MTLTKKTKAIGKIARADYTKRATTKKAKSTESEKQSFTFEVCMTFPSPSMESMAELGINKRDAFAFDDMIFRAAGRHSTTSRVEIFNDQATEREHVWSVESFEEGAEMVKRLTKLRLMGLFGSKKKTRVYPSIRIECWPGWWSVT